MSTPTITNAVVHPAIGFGSMAKVTATLTNGEEITIFEFFDDELSFHHSEFIGMTVEQALDHKCAKDVAYLQA